MCVKKFNLQPYKCQVQKCSLVIPKEHCYCLGSVFCTQDLMADMLQAHVELTHKLKWRPTVHLFPALRNQNHSPSCPISVLTSASVVNKSSATERQQDADADTIDSGDIDFSTSNALEHLTNTGQPSNNAENVVTVNPMDIACSTSTSALRLSSVITEPEQS